MTAPLRERVNTLAFTALQRIARRRGYEIVDRAHMPPDYDQSDIDLFGQVKPYTLTSHERMFALRQSVKYVVAAGIPGAIVECGVWRGGSMLIVAHTLLELGQTDRDLFLFDTFETMPPPGERDVDVWGTPAADSFEAALASPVYAYLPENEVRRLMVATGYPEERLHFVKGMVEDTIPHSAPDGIALCRLDTDWYESTAHEMAHLYPRIAAGGVLLIDDYGLYMGAKQAVDEYIEDHDLGVLLNRIDDTGRLVLVPPHDGS
jgi:hypothetical protein